ncbi:MAG: alpha/beta hydrolase [Chitinophagales bacterium]|nr:alpha/beta hydrolase [Chitinophagaceae bacterium]MCB9064779.1 alpha/beta hydrolase [Chitinophagales bacterium]
MFEHDNFRINKLQLDNGCNVAYIDEGSGKETLLFIHGLATYANSWRMNIDDLKQHHRCIAIDLPGNGYSDKGDYPYGIGFFAESVYEFIQKLKLDKIIVIGHSMGGQVSIKLITDHPDVCKKLILCAPAGFETFNGIERALYEGSVHFFDFFSTEENSLRKVIKSSFYKYPPMVEEMLQELVDLMKDQSISHYRKMIEACIKGMLSEEVFDKLSTIQQPTLVLFGERDALIPNRLIHPISTKRLAERGAAEIPNSKLVVIDHCGHFLQIEKAEFANSLMSEFIG